MRNNEICRLLVLLSLSLSLIMYLLIWILDTRLGDYSKWTEAPTWFRIIGPPGQSTKIIVRV